MSSTDKSRSVSIFAIVDGRRPSGIAYATPEIAQQALDNPLGWYEGGRIEERPFSLQADQFWLGDTIAVELHRGAIEDDDGIRTGGSWLETIGYVEPRTIELATGNIDGVLRQIGTGRFLQAMEMRAGVRGYPFRNARLVDLKEHAACIRE